VCSSFLPYLPFNAPASNGHNLAMWINFSASQPFAIKLYVGGVNAISGVPINETPEAMIKRLQVSEKVKQDYIVLPEQPWLDGIASEDGRIRQFVAMPKGSGYSVEVQVTGEEKIGGLQLEITPAKLGFPMPMRTKLYEHTSSHNSPAEKALDLRGKGLNDSSTVLDLKRILENEFQVSIKYQKLRFENNSYSTILPKLDDDSTILGEIYVPHVSSLIHSNPRALTTARALFSDYRIRTANRNTKGGWVQHPLVSQQPPR
jgi:hypothetical protein